MEPELDLYESDFLTEEVNDRLGDVLELSMNLNWLNEDGTVSTRLSNYADLTLKAYCLVNKDVYC